MKLLTQEGAIAGTRSEDLTNKFSTLHWFIKSGGVRTREYDFKSFIKRYVSGSTLGRLHNTMGIYIHGSGHKLSMWYHVVLGHSAESLLVLITLRGRRFEPFARRQRISLLVKGITTARAAVIYTMWMRTGQIQLRNNHLR